MQNNFVGMTGSRHCPILMTTEKFVGQIRAQLHIAQTIINKN
jgi:hypothetical protein